MHTTIAVTRVLIQYGVRTLPKVAFCAGGFGLTVLGLKGHDLSPKQRLYVAIPSSLLVLGALSTLLMKEESHHYTTSSGPSWMERLGDRMESIALFGHRYYLNETAILAGLAGLCMWGLKCRGMSWKSQVVVVAASTVVTYVSIAFRRIGQAKEQAKIDHRIRDEAPIIVPRVDIADREAWYVEKGVGRYTPVALPPTPDEIGFTLQTKSPKQEVPSSGPASKGLGTYGQPEDIESDPFEPRDEAKDLWRTLAEHPRVDSDRPVAKEQTAWEVAQLLVWALNAQLDVKQKNSWQVHQRNVGLIGRGDDSHDGRQGCETWDDATLSQVRNVVLSKGNFAGVEFGGLDFCDYIRSDFFRGVMEELERLQIILGWEVKEVEEQIHLGKIPHIQVGWSPIIGARQGLGIYDPRYSGVNRFDSVDLPQDCITKDRTVAEGVIRALNGLLDRKRRHHVAICRREDTNRAYEALAVTDVRHFTLTISELREVVPKTTTFNDFVGGETFTDVMQELKQSGAIFSYIYKCEQVPRQVQGEVTVLDEIVAIDVQLGRSPKM